MKKIVKKLSLLLVIVMLITTLVTPAITANAEVYPAIGIDRNSENSTIYVGETGQLLFYINNVTSSQRYVIKIYNSAGNMVGSVEADGYNGNYSQTTLTINVDTAALGLPVGTYTVEFYMKWTQGGYNYENTTHGYTNLYIQNKPVVGFAKEGGVYRYYSNGAPSYETGLVKYAGKYFYLVNGYWQNTYTGLVKYNGKWFYVANGKWASTATTLVKINGKWFFVQKGKWIIQDVLVKYKGKYFYVKGGKWQSNYKGFVYYKGTYFYVVNGKWANTTTTFVKVEGREHYVKNGKFTRTVAIVKYKGKRYYVWDGVKQTKYTGKVKVGGKTYKIKKGVVQ